MDDEDKRKNKQENMTEYCRSCCDCFRSNSAGDR